MKGLLLKDAYQIWHYAKGVIVGAVVMMGAGVVTIMNGANFFIICGLSDGHDAHDPAGL